MRFIGGKSALLNNIDSVISQHAVGTERVFCDIFAGTGAVARYFKPKYEVYSNDLLHFSYVIQKATIENNQMPLFDKLNKLGIADPIKFLEETAIPHPEQSGNHFIAQNYSPGEHCDRMYISNKNAVRIDFIRNTIECWKQMNLLNEVEYFYLLAGLIEGVPYVSNITGTYGAYLKTWDKRAYKEFEMMRLDVLDNNRPNKSYNMDANKLIKELEGDILYLDPPYNSRQYAPNYHLLETISKYDNPKIGGITGMRPYQNEKSDFCIKSQVVDAFDDLLHKAKFTNIVLSYSSAGMMSAPQIEQVMKRHGIKSSYARYDIPYRKYKSKIADDEKNVCEYLFYIKKNIPHKKVFDFPKTEVNSKLPSSNKKYIKSPLNYIGGKYKLLPQILPHFPADIATFVDLFSGGSNVAINVHADNIICNDINSKIIELFQTLQRYDIISVLNQIERNIDEFALSKENEAGFLAFREHYNKTKDPIDLYTLTCYSFNYQFRFNNNHEYNNPFGRNRSRFSDNMRQNLIAFAERLSKLNIEFINKDFTQFDISLLQPQDMMYCDPPYLITVGSYNDGNRGFKDWGKTEEQQLYDFLDSVDGRHVRFALSNVMEHKGQTNKMLADWSKKYKVINLDYHYSNSSYNTKREKSCEVLITNY